MRFFLVALFLCPFFIMAESSPIEKDQKKKEQLKENASITEHTVKIGGKEISYIAETGTIILRDAKDEPKATFFYVAYTKKDADRPSRPVSFCFNGGPGSSSVWLHMGALGPQRVLVNESGIADPPYRFIDNEYSILDATDLVFIDPVSTGYSRPAPGEDAKQFHAMDEDVKTVAEFIRLYTTRNLRWESPKFLIGESYGTTRAAALTEYLHDEFFCNLNGVMLISACLNFQTTDVWHKDNDLPFLLFLPSYTAAAWYHKKLPADLQNDLHKALVESENFAMKEFSLALLHGNNLTAQDRKQTIAKLSRLTGLSESYLDQANMRVSVGCFGKELLRSDKKLVGRFDSRITGLGFEKCGDFFEYDPSWYIFGAFTAAFNQYVRADLKWESDEKYEILANVNPWNWGDRGSNKYVNVADSLSEAMIKNPGLRVFVANGYFDLATPYFATEFTINHMYLDEALQSNIQMEYYEAGHMMYTHMPSLIKLKADLNRFIDESKGRKQKLS